MSYPQFCSNVAKIFMHLSKIPVVFVALLTAVFANCNLPAIF